MTPEQLVRSLTYRAYAYNREHGLSAERAARVFGPQAVALEAAYQRELRQHGLAPA